MAHDACAGSVGDMDPRLTRNERLVLSVLSASKGAMKAYELLSSLKDHGVKAPMTVYRALDRLEEKGLIHKLDAVNAFVVCNHDTPHPVQTFSICSVCNKVEELEETGPRHLDWRTVQGLADPRRFSTDSVRVELRGICADCAA